MLTYLPLVMQVVLVLIVMTAGIYDLRFRRIPNWLVLVGLVLGFGLNTFLFGLSGLERSAMGMGLALLIYFPLYLLRAMGAGDAKLMAAVGAIVGPVRSALQAAEPPDITVQLQNAATARPVVQAVYILRNQCKVRFLALKLDQGEVGRVRLGRGNGLPAPIVPFPNQAGVAQKGLRGRQFLRLILLPKTAIAPKSGYAAFGGNAGSGQDGDLRRSLDPLAGLIHRAIICD